MIEIDTYDEQNEIMCLNKVTIFSVTQRSPRKTYYPDLK